VIRVEQANPTEKPWRYLVDHSHQATLYVLPEWLSLHPVEAALAYDGTEVQGGIVVTHSLTPLPFVPYQGMLLRRREDREVAQALIAWAEKRGRPISVWNPPSLIDIRPFTWRWFDAQVLWQPDIRYTYMTAATTQLEPRCQRNVTEKPVEETKSGDWFQRWKSQPWVTDEYEATMAKIAGMDSVSVWTDGDGTVVWGRDGAERGYYLGSVGRPTNVLLRLIRSHDVSDLVGCNSPARAIFKRGFGGTLRTAYGMRLI